VVRVHYPYVSPSQEDLQVLRHALYDDDMGRTDSVSRWVQPKNASRVKREGYADTRLDDISLTDGRIAPGWSTLGEVAQGSKACTFGPEISFGTHMAAAKPGHKITILKVTWPGCDIVTYRKSLYPTIISTLREYDADVEIGAYELAGMLWLQGESDAGVREKDIWSATQTYPSAAAYGARLQDRILALRKDTGKQVPFAALTMRVFGDRALGAFPAANNPHNFDVINEAFEKLASTLPSVYAVNGQRFITNRYFDDGTREHCLSAAQQHCLGPRLAAMLLVGGCLIQKDLHFTARGQIRVGVEFAVTLLDAEKEKYGLLPHGVNTSVRVDAAVLPHRSLA